MKMVQQIAGLLTGAVLLMTGCGRDGRQSEAEKAGMGRQEKPWWHDMYEEEKAKARRRIAELIETSPTYPRPPADPDLYWSGKGNKIIVVDRKTGDYLLYAGASKEGELSAFDFTTKHDEFVVEFKTQMSGGFGMKWDRYPIRVYGIVEANNQTPEVREARKRMSMARFAQFIAALPTFSRHPEQDFVVIDAPLRPGERMSP